MPGRPFHYMVFYQPESPVVDPQNVAFSITCTAPIGPSVSRCCHALLGHGLFRIGALTIRPAGLEPW